MEKIKYWLIENAIMDVQRGNQDVIYTLIGVLLVGISSEFGFIAVLIFMFTSQYALEYYFRIGRIHRDYIVQDMYKNKILLDKQNTINKKTVKK